MRNVTLTPQQRKEIHDLYMDDSVGLREIAKAYQIDASTVSRIAKQEGATPRCPQIGANRPKTRRLPVRKEAKKCKTCGKHVEIVGAKFCPYCGTDIRSPKELLTQRINAFAPKIKYLPESCRDELMNLFVDIKAELAKE
jgi:tRNA(Ile2) C34 agmatinyltransferase TiaS